MFAKQVLYCQICSQLFKTNFSPAGGGYGKGKPCCSKEYFDEREWRYTLAIMGKKYYPQGGNHE